jgi:GT2 family glycosyltransferase
MKREFPKIRLIETGRNAGFAKACNIGIAASGGEYILLLNSDTRIIGDALDKMVSYLDEHADTAVVTSRLVYPDFTDQGVARHFPSPINALFGRKSILTKLFPKNRFARKYMISRSRTSGGPFEVDWVSGACLMARQNVLAQVGYLDDQFFMYWEDADVCYRIKQKGWKIVCVPDAVIIHCEGKSSGGKMNSRLIFEFNRSVYRYYRKHHIHHWFDMMNFLALAGLTLRTLVLLAGNCLTKAYRPRREKEASVEKTC